MHLAAVKNGVSDLPNTLLRFDGGPNGLSVRLLASYMLGDGQNGLSELLQASYTLGGGQTGLSVLQQASYTLGVVETDSPYFNNLLRYLTVVKTTL